MIIENRLGLQTELRGGGFLLSDMTRSGYNGLRGVPGSGVTYNAIAGVPALARAVRIKAEALASLRLQCITGTEPFTKPAPGAWQARLFAGRANPAQTRFGFWETIGESLGWRNNAFIWMNTDPASGRLVEWWALHPDQITPRAAGWRVTVQDGYLDPVGKGRGRYDVTDQTILHIRGHGNGGQRLAPDTITVFREALAVPLARQRREAKMWQKGAHLQLAVEFPEGYRSEQVKAWKDLWQETYEGPDGDSTAVMGGGGVIKPIGMTMEQAQWAESARLTISDATRITGVPGRLLGVTTERAIPLEPDLTEWLRFGLGPDLERIESHLEEHPALFTSARVRPKFDTNDFVRGDLLTQANIEHLQIQDGSALIDEIRARRGQEPLPDGVGQIPQIIPVGGSAHGVPLPSTE